MAGPVETPIGPVTVEHFRPGAVRHRVVVGPKFLFALFNPRDRMHDVARAFMAFIRDGELPYRRLVVNEHIVDEAATRLKKRATMRQAATCLSTLESSQVYQLAFVPDDAFANATDRFRDWTDLGASFTDFVVVAHMEAAGIDHIATFDAHYDAFDVTTLPYRA
ncbi:MAG: type II toxin-antitoxin system VapC family toxin [Halobacteriales archaeon]